jgi:protein-L-isoaspartate(D-aspartate) O-methyltransferase
MQGEFAYGTIAGRWRWRLVICLCCVLYFPSLSADTYVTARQRLVELIEDDVRATSAYLGQETLDPRILTAIGSVPRHEFVPPELKSLAYENRPLPIGHGQTISQPYIVAIMTDLLRVKSAFRVLEIGTGSGYQAAILAELVNEVYSIEIIKPLADTAETRLTRLGYHNIKTRHGDGYYGWQQHAPFDAIIVTAAAGHIPPPLIKQLKVGGRMIIPVGSRFMAQELLLVEKVEDEKITTRQILPVRFVPLTGKH